MSTTAARMVRFCTGSETLAQQVQMLLNRLGIYAWITVRQGGKGKFSNNSDRVVNRQPLYQVGYTESKKWDMVARPTPILSSRSAK